MLRARGTHHPTDELGDKGSVHCLTERHHHFGARAVPTGTERHLEQHYSYMVFPLNTGRRHLSDMVASRLDRLVLLEAVNNLAVGQLAQSAL